MIKTYYTFNLEEGIKYLNDKKENGYELIQIIKMNNDDIMQVSHHTARFIFIYKENEIAKNISGVDLNLVKLNHLKERIEHLEKENYYIKSKLKECHRLNKDKKNAKL